MRIRIETSSVTPGVFPNLLPWVEFFGGEGWYAALSDRGEAVLGGDSALV